MKQLDVDVSPPAFVWTPYLTLTLVTFDLDPMIIYFQRYDFFLVFFSSLSQTDRKRCIRAHRACAQVGSKNWGASSPRKKIDNMRTCTREFRCTGVYGFF